MFFGVRNHLFVKFLTLLGLIMESVHMVMTAANADAATWTVSLFFHFQIVPVDIMADFEFTVAHGAALVFGQITQLVGH